MGIILVTVSKIDRLHDQSGTWRVIDICIRGSCEICECVRGRWAATDERLFIEVAGAGGRCLRCKTAVIK